MTAEERHKWQCWKLDGEYYEVVPPPQWRIIERLSARVHDAALDRERVPLAVERQGRTDCRECVWFDDEWIEPPLNRTQALLAEHKPGCWCTDSPLRGAGPEYCGDFVEVIL